METQKPFLKDEDGEEVDVHMYRSMIGSLMYLTSSRPDIMFVVCAYARYQVNPKVSHLYAMKRIFRYIKGQLKLGLWYPKDSPFDLVAYADIDIAFDYHSQTRSKTKFQCCGLSAKELKEFLSLYPIPLEYDVILSTSTQTIFDAPPGYAGLLNPFGCAKLKTFIIMCKAYGCEPSVDLFRGFFNLCRAGSWLTFQKSSEKHIQNLLPKVITHIEGWNERFFFVQDSIISSKYPQLLLDEKMAFRNFIYTEDDDDLAFLPKEPSPGFGTGSPSASVNTELPKDVEEPEVQPAEITTDSGESPKAGVFIVHPGSVAARIKERKCKTRGGSSRPPVKRKLASGSSSSRVVRAKTSASKDDAPILSISDDDEGLPDCFELKDANACHLKIFAVTPPAWKGHLC
ncbi:hypothetical protein Tco_0052819 [Tanacetum coccineum]